VLPLDVREHNERLLLSIIRGLGPTPASHLARHSGLSAQTVSVILRSLENEGLILRGQPVKGRVGKPSVPIMLNKRGAYSVGMKLGRRSADLALMDFHGTVLDERHIQYRFPAPKRVFSFLQNGMDNMISDLPTQARSRVVGIGIAMPFDIWKWNEQVGAPMGEIEAWRSIDFAAEVAAFTEIPVAVMNDATAACYAENTFGIGPAYLDYAYIYVGFFVGGGIVLNGSVFEGQAGNAGAIGPLRSSNAAGESVQLMDVASLHTLEAAIARIGGDPTLLWKDGSDWSDFADQVDTWIDEAGHAIAAGMLSACAIIDFEAVVIDGAMPNGVRRRLIDCVAGHFTEMDSRGIIPPVIREGTVGVGARVRGAAYGPIAAQHFLLGSFSPVSSPPVLLS